MCIWILQYAYLYVYLFFCCMFVYIYFHLSMTHADIMCCCSFIRYVERSQQRNVQNVKRSNAGDGGGALWPGAKCQGLSLRQSSHDKRSSEVRVDWTQPIFQVLVKGGNHIIPTTPFTRARIIRWDWEGRSQSFWRVWFDWWERFDWCLKIAPDNFCKVFFKRKLWRTIIVHNILYRLYSTCIWLHLGKHDATPCFEPPQGLTWEPHTARIIHLVLFPGGRTCLSRTDGKRVVGVGNGSGT